MPSDVTRLGRDDDWSQVRAVVAGFGVTGASAADTLNHLGAHVEVLDERTPTADLAERARILDLLGVQFHHGPTATETLPADTDLVIASPGWPPASALFRQAADRDIPVWGDVELAWRLRSGDAAPWLVVTGTNGKTTTVRMLESILRAAGFRARAVGNIGTPILEAVMDPEGPEVLVVELSSFQLHWVRTMSAHAAVVLNVAPDHLDWHGDEQAYAAAKARAYENVRVACVWNVQDEATRRLVEEADVIEGARAIGFTLGIPEPGMVGRVDDLLVDRAFVVERAHSAAELVAVTDLPDQAPHTIANALAAAALARSFGVRPPEVRAGLRAFQPEPHRIERIAHADEVTWIDDSKATNTHAALASLRSAESVVWIAGGLAKGARYEDLVTEVAPRLRAVVLIGADRAPLREALAAVAPEVAVVEIEETGAEAIMAAAVSAARAHAQAGDTVLLAPGAASMDQFDNYHHRGDTFATAVRESLTDRDH